MQICDMPIVMLRSLIITIFIETTIAFVLRYRKKDLINVILVNILTNPLVNCLTIFVNVYYGKNMRTTTLVILEIFAFITEGYIYKKYLHKQKPNGFLLSLILNISSLIFGIIINLIIY